MLLQSAKLASQLELSAAAVGTQMKERLEPLVVTSRGARRQRGLASNHETSAHIDHLSGDESRLV